MKRVVFATAYAALLVAVAYGTYVFGWYQGLTYHSVVAGLSEAKVTVAAAQSLRQAEPQLALELLETNIHWMDRALTASADDVPANEQGNFDIVMRRLREYENDHGKLVH